MAGAGEWRASFRYWRGAVAHTSRTRPTPRKHTHARLVWATGAPTADGTYQRDELLATVVRRIHELHDLPRREPGC